MADAFSTGFLLFYQYILGTATNFNLKLVFPRNTSSAPPIVPFWYASLSLPRLARKSFTLFLKSVTAPSIDIFATSVDYKGNADLAVKFFKTVQNKMLFAVTGNTAAEIIYLRLDGQKDYLGLTNFKGDFPLKQR